jgi:two-component system response regulator EvgA
VSLPRFRVLVVDDHASFRRAARALLALRGFLVVGEADCGAGARCLVEALRPDGVLLDLRLGAECGLEVARALTAASPGLSIVLTSADDTHPGEEHVAASGARGFIAKDRLGRVDPATFCRAAIETA